MPGIGIGLSPQKRRNNLAGGPLTSPASVSWDFPENSTSAIGRIPASRGVRGNYTYSKSGTDAASFTLDTSTGFFNLTSAADAETKSSYTFTGTVFDGTNTVNIPITINITGEDEFAPTFASPSTINIASGTSLIVDFIISDADVGEEDATFTISGGANRTLFEIAEFLGELQFIEPPSAGTYYVEVTAHKGIRQVKQTITVNVADTAAPSVDVSQPNLQTITTNQPDGFPIGPIATTGTVQSASTTTTNFKVEMVGSVPWLYIEGTGLTTGVKTVGIDLVGEGGINTASGNVSVTVVASVASPTIAITVTNQNVAHDAAAGTKLADIVLTNPHSTESITLTLDEASTAWELVEISELVFELRVDTEVDFAALAGSNAIVCITADNTYGYPSSTVNDCIVFAIEPVGETLGTEEWPQPLFAASTNLFLGGGWTVAAGVASCDGSGGILKVTPSLAPLDADTDYRWDFEITARTAGDVSMTDGVTTHHSAKSAVQTYTVDASSGSAIAYASLPNPIDYTTGAVHYAGQTLSTDTGTDIYGTTWQEYLAANDSNTLFKYSWQNTMPTVASGSWFINFIVKNGSFTTFYLNPTNGGTNGDCKWDLTGEGSVYSEAGGTAGVRKLPDGSYHVWVLKTSYANGALYYHLSDNSHAINFVANSQNVYLGSAWISDATGKTEPDESGPHQIIFDGGSSFNGSIDNVSVKTVSGGAAAPLNAFPASATEYDYSTSPTHYYVTLTADTGTDYTGTTYRKYAEDNTAAVAHYSKEAGTSVTLGDYFYNFIVKTDENTRFAMNTALTTQHNFSLTGSGSVTSGGVGGIRKYADNSYHCWIKMSGYDGTQDLYYQLIKESDGSIWYTGTTGNGVLLGGAWVEPVDGRLEPTALDGGIELVSSTPVLSLVSVSDTVREDAALNTVLWNASATLPNSGTGNHVFTVADSTGTAVSSGAVTINSTTGQGKIANTTAWAALSGTTIVIDVTADNDEGTPDTDTKSITIQVTVAPVVDDLGPELWADNPNYVGTHAVNSFSGGWSADVLVDNKYTKTGASLGNVGMSGINSPLIAGRMYRHKITIETTNNTGQLYYGWSGKPGGGDWSVNIAAAPTETVLEFDKIAATSTLYALYATADGWLGTVKDYSVKEVIGAGGDGGGTSSSGDGVGAYGIGTASYNALKSKLDSYIANPNAWYTRNTWPHPLDNQYLRTDGTRRLTVADGYNRLPLFWGLNYAYRVTKQDNYMQVAYDTSTEYIDDGYDYTGDGYHDWSAKDRPSNPRGRNYNPHPHAPSGWNHDHYEWRAAAGIAMTLRTLMNNPNCALSTAGNKLKLAAWLRDHVWNKWQVYAIENGTASESNINTTGSYFVMRIAPVVMALYEYYGGSAYYSWLVSKVGNVNNMIINNSSGGVMQRYYAHHTGNQNIVSDISHAGDGIGVLREVQETYPEIVPQSTCVLVAKGLNQVIWSDSEYGFSKMTDGTGGWNTANYGPNVGGWVPIIKYDDTNLGKYIDWALTTLEVIQTSTPTDNKAAIWGGLMEVMSL